MSTKTEKIEKFKVWEDKEGCQELLFKYQRYCKTLDEFFALVKPYGIELTPETLIDFRNRGETFLLDQAQRAYTADLQTVPEMLRKSIKPFDVLAFTRVYINYHNALGYLRDHDMLNFCFITVNNGHCVLTPEGAKEINDCFECYIETPRQKEVYTLTQSILKEYSRLVEIVTEAGFAPEDFLFNGRYGLIAWDTNTAELEFNYNLLNDLK